MIDLDSIPCGPSTFKPGLPAPNGVIHTLNIVVVSSTYSLQPYTNEGQNSSLPKLIGGPAGEVYMSCVAESKSTSHSPTALIPLEKTSHGQ